MCSRETSQHPSSRALGPALPSYLRAVPTVSHAIRVLRIALFGVEAENEFEFEMMQTVVLGLGLVSVAVLVLVLVVLMWSVVVERTESTSLKGEGE